MEKLLAEIKSCTICQEFLPYNPNPVVVANRLAKVIIIGQAPGKKVHDSNIPWNDLSGEQLRKWMQIDKNDFYDESNIAIVPMGFCYPGKGKSGDLPPRPECAPQWHAKLNKEMPNIQLTLLIGQYAQKYYLGENVKKNLTETVRNYEEFLPNIIPLPHPSPRNRFWLKKNDWFEYKIIPILRERLKQVISL